MTSLRSLYVPHGLLPTPKAPLLKSLAIGLCALSLSGKYLQCLFHSAWFTTTYYLLLTTYYLLLTTYYLLHSYPPHGITHYYLYKKIRANTWRLFCVFRGLLSPHKFGQRLSVPCENYCTQTSQNCADTLRNFAPLREKKDMSFCSYVQNFVSHRIHGTHRILLRMVLRMSAPSA